MLKTLLICLFFIYCILSFKNRNMNNPYKLYMVFGKKGSGKSTYLCKKALEYKKKGYTIYTNMEDIMLDDFRIIDPSQLGLYVPEPKSCVLLDEVGMLYDNRDYKNFKPAVRDFFKLQRHYKTVVFMASQSFDVDKKLRDLTDRMFLVSTFFPWLSLVRPISKRIGLVEASSQGESRLVDNLKFGSILQYRFIYLPSYFKYFDSFIAPEKPFLEFRNSTGAGEKPKFRFKLLSRHNRREASKNF